MQGTPWSHAKVTQAIEAYKVQFDENHKFIEEEE
jgi:hypothetical protein